MSLSFFILIYFDSLALLLYIIALKNEQYALCMATHFSLHTLAWNLYPEVFTGKYTGFCMVVIVYGTCQKKVSGLSVSTSKVRTVLRMVRYLAACAQFCGRSMVHVKKSL